RRHALDVADLEQKVALPGEAVVLAVGDQTQADVLLQPHHAADRRVLNAHELRLRDFALLRRDARRKQRVGPDQAADMVGTERRFGSFGHGFLVRFGRFPPHAIRVKGWQMGSRLAMVPQSLGYVGVRAKDLGDWASYGTGLLGLQRIDK